MRVNGEKIVEKIVISVSLYRNNYTIKRTDQFGEMRPPEQLAASSSLIPPSKIMLFRNESFVNCGPIRCGGAGLTQSGEFASVNKVCASGTILGLN